MSKLSIPGFAVLIAAGLSAAAGEPAPATPASFVFFNLERDRIREPSFLETDAIAGAQLKYTWRELEPERDRYELKALLEDLAFLAGHGKGLFVQIQDVTFDERINVPDYLIQDPAFSGGAARKWEAPEGEGGEARFDGWVARRWDPAVIDRFVKLLTALGEATDGRIEGITLPETAIGFADPTLHPPGFGFDAYVIGIKAIMTAAREAFPRSHVIQYANFMPGEWLPWNDKGYLQSIYEHAAKTGVGVGGPDLMPHRRGQQNHAYRFIAARPEGVVAGVAVQDGNLAERNPMTKQPVTAAQLHAFAKQDLRADYVFWGTEEPYYSEQVLPLLGAARVTRKP